MRRRRDPAATTRHAHRLSISLILLALAAASCGGGTHHDVDLTLSGSLMGHSFPSLRVRCPPPRATATAQAACASLALDRDARVLAPDTSVHIIQGPAWNVTLTGSFYGSTVSTDLGLYTHAFEFWVGYLRHVRCRGQRQHARVPRTACEAAAAVA
jgi:hypothetical protein